MGWRCEVCLVTNDDDDTLVCICCEHKKPNGADLRTTDPTFLFSCQPNTNSTVFTFGNTSMTDFGTVNNIENSSSVSGVGFIPVINVELPSTPLQTSPSSVEGYIKYDIEVVPVNDSTLTEYDESYDAKLEDLLKIYSNKISKTPLINKNKYKIPSASIWSWGSSECDQLGVEEKYLNDELCTTSPIQVLSGLKNHRVIDVSVGALHSIALTNEGLLLSWGCNDDGALGRVSKRRQVELSKENSDNDEEENIYNNDYNDMEDLELDEDNDKYPYLVSLSNKVNAISVVCGDCYSACLTDNGRVYLWGSYKDSSGYIGFPNYSGVDSGSLKLKEYNPTLLPCFFRCRKGSRSTKRLRLDNKGSNIDTEEDPVIYISGGENHTIVITRSGTLYGWGSAEFGQFGINPIVDNHEHAKLDKYKYLYPVELTNKVLEFPVHYEIVNAFCGRATTFFVVKNNRKKDVSKVSLYACGRNGHGELGLGEAGLNKMIVVKPKKVYINFRSDCIHYEDYSFPQSSYHPCSSPIKVVGSGQYYSAALTCCGEVYTWGISDCCGNKNSKVLPGISNKDITIPTRLQYLKNISSLGFGSDCCFAIHKTGLVYAWGMNLTGQIVSDIDGTQEVILKPIILDPALFLNKYMLKVTGGSQHSIGLAWDNKYVNRAYNLHHIKKLEDDYKLRRLNALYEDNILNIGTDTTKTKKSTPLNTKEIAKAPRISRSVGSPSNKGSDNNTKCLKISTNKVTSTFKGSTRKSTTKVKVPKSSQDKGQNDRKKTVIHDITKGKKVKKLIDSAKKKGDSTEVAASLGSTVKSTKSNSKKSLTLDLRSKALGDNKISKATSKKPEDNSKMHKLKTKAQESRITSKSIIVDSNEVHGKSKQELIDTTKVRSKSKTGTKTLKTTLNKSVPVKSSLTTKEKTIKKRNYKQTK
ncbi:regulator of chromosome condensation family protein [Cryptosporidium muris RN66]|uniref:Regulator of chromosome condensation family protein n=1 Tax=Cryptosporidium muris (strain RN66) TaxID=441375 RepID=B6AHT0_CRYMR|nr:regulator of chromosome condensation family protein [Cryptosporidium muris RN66]EEA07771.1 regulator of chromosome condensation family protein [Cryptosporidium muris RN66]|eukprot:XP_002142120.1 regulator of chromosome condensation family protein [Cryptosporidium muris RN66]